MDNDQRLRLTREAWDNYRDTGVTKLDDLYYLTLRSYTTAKTEENTVATTKYAYTLVLLCLMSSRSVDWYKE